MSSLYATQKPDKPSISKHAIIILASGLSQRLGQAKQLLYKDGTPLINYMTMLALTTSPQAVIVVIPNNNSAIDSEIGELSVQYPVIRTVVNSMPETGMAHSLYLGIETLINTSALFDRVLIMGVDQILLDVSHLTALLAGKQVVVASGYHNWQDLDEASSNAALKKDIVGLPLAIDYELLKQWQSILVGDKGLRYLIRGLPASQISTVINDQLSYDIDTPKQLDYAKQRGWLSK